MGNLSLKKKLAELDDMIAKAEKTTTVSMSVFISSLKRKRDIVASQIGKGKKK